MALFVFDTLVTVPLYVLMVNSPREERGELNIQHNIIHNNNDPTKPIHHLINDLSTLLLPRSDSLPLQPHPHSNTTQQNSTNIHLRRPLSKLRVYSQRTGIEKSR